MRLPKSPPDWGAILRDPPAGLTLPSIFALFTRDDVKELVRHANDCYLHWDKLRRYPMPNGSTPNLMWTAVALSRSQQFRTLPLSGMDDEQLKFWTPIQHQAWLHKIDTRGGGTIGSRSKDIPNDGSDTFLFNSLMEEAIASSQLEGASTTRPVAKQMLRTGRRPKDRHERMILNNYNAILEIRDSKTIPLTPQFICDIHEIITNKTLDDPSAAGRFRTSAENVDVVDTFTDEVIFKPPSAHSVERRIDELCEFANDTSSAFIHPVQKAILLHFMLGFIHPFVDGNGRTARAIFYWYMLKHGYWIFEFLPISRIVLDSPARYVRAYLYAETDGFDATYFLHYHLRIIDRAVREMHEYVERQQSIIEQTSALIESMNLNHRQIKAAHRAIRQPHLAFTVKEHAGTHRVALATARADLLGLVKHNILMQAKRGKQIIFLPVKELRDRIDKSAFRKVSKPQRLAVTRSTQGQQEDIATTTTTTPSEGNREIQMDLFKTY